MKGNKKGFCSYFGIKKMIQDFSNVSLEAARSIEAKQTKQLLHDFLIANI